MKINSQSGQVGFFVALLMAALLVVAGSVAINTSQSTQRSATETQSVQSLNLGESGLEFLQAGQANSFIDNPLGLDLNELNKNFVARPDQGVVYDLNQGDTLELNPTIADYCRTSSCVVKIWWNNQGMPAAGSCDGQAALLISEYSQDAFDANQTAVEASTCTSSSSGYQQCLSDAGSDGTKQAQCKEFYSTCSGAQSAADNAASIDPRTGLSRERARYYLFRPAVCAFDTAVGRDWAGYETAIGNNLNIYTDTAQYPGIGTKTNMLGISDTDSKTQGYGSVTIQPTKTWQDFPSNPALTQQFANYYEIPVWPNTTIVRIKPLYAGTQVLIDMPGQILQGVSSASDGQTVRTVEVKQTLPSVPGVMDYALFVGGGSIDKRATAPRD